MGMIVMMVLVNVAAVPARLLCEEQTLTSAENSVGKQQDRKQGRRIFFYCGSLY